MKDTLEISIATLRGFSWIRIKQFRFSRLLLSSFLVPKSGFVTSGIYDSDGRSRDENVLR